MRRPDRDASGDLLALFVSGPSGGTCHLLPPHGLVTLGRSDESAIVLDDVGASRSHAVLHIAEPIMLSDLGSANGTIVGEERLPPSTARILLPGESFRIGDLALLLRPSGLKALRPGAVVTLEELPERIAAVRPVADQVVMRARVERARDRGLLEAILANLPETSTGGADPVIVRLGGCRVGMIMPAGLLAGANPSARDAAVDLERLAVEHLDRWGLGAQLEAIRLRATSADELGEAALRFLAGGTGGGERLLLRCGTAIIHDEAMDELRRTVETVARAPVPVLILGETGVGKDVFASMLHELSPRSHGAFVRINCASLPETLLESELFGHERGAFTGASRAKAGLLESADGGTVFLDEIGELTPALQGKLLAAIESREVTRIGALQPRTIDVRFVAATNRDLATEVETGRFRRDLFYRLQLVTLTVPPLRDRPSDVEPLARHFLEQARIRFDLPVMNLSSASVGALQAWRWPGNVRELRNVIERAALLSGASLIEPRHLGLVARGEAAAVPPRPTGSMARPAVDEAGAERRSIEAALKECAGNQSRAAQVLRMSRRTLVRKIAQLGLRRPLAIPVASPAATPLDGDRDASLKS